jgi:hypothetical protein
MGNIIKPNDIVYNWEDCGISFVCPNCGADLVADSQNEAMECDCGLKYSLIATLNVEMPDDIADKIKKMCANFNLPLTT